MLHGCLKQLYCFYMYYIYHLLKMLIQNEMKKLFPSPLLSLLYIVNLQVILSNSKKCDLKYKVRFSGILVSILMNVSFSINAANLDLKVNVYGAGVVMNYTYDIDSEPIDQPFTTSGEVCGSGIIELAASENGVQYSLYRTDRFTMVTNPYGFTKYGDGVNPVTFNEVFDDGTYTVRAISPSGGCTTFMSGSLTIINPINYNLQATGATKYCSGLSPTNIDLQLDGSQAGYSYQLQRSTNGGLVFNNYLTAKGSVAGEALTWNDVEFGEYRVLVTVSDVAACQETMGSVIITESPLPTATIHIDPLYSSKCENEFTKTFPILVDLTGTAPFDITIKDDKTPASTYTENNWPNKFYNAYEVSPNETTTYTIVSVTDGNGCTNNSGIGSATVTVNPLTSPIFDNLALSYCENVGSVSLGGNPVGGTFYIDNGGGPVAYPGISSFDPASFLVGTSTNISIYYEVNDGCVGVSPTQNTEVYALSTEIKKEEVEIGLVYPNPTNGVVKFSTDLITSRYQLYNISGELVRKGEVDNSMIDISELSNGIYILKINNMKFKIEKR